MESSFLTRGQALRLWSGSTDSKTLDYQKINPQFSSDAQTCQTPCDPMDCSMPGLSVHHQLPEFAQTHVHWVMPSNHLIPFCPLLLLPSMVPSIRWEFTQKKPLEYKTQHNPTTSSTLCRAPHLSNKQNKKKTQLSAERFITSLSLAHQRKNKQTKHQHNLTQYKAYTSH